MLYLINPRTFTIAAVLIPDKEIVIKSDWIARHIANNGGIYLSQTFKEKNASVLEKNNLANRLYLLPPEDDKPELQRLFAKAFKECLYEDGLRQMGYYWKDSGEVDDLTPSTIALCGSIV